ncbi:MAG: hypothetical protein VXX01_09300, partial [Pseudomonadota bacterium]|nr:hypothetical protein [Pseudomonadota bacterium]
GAHMARIIEQAAHPDMLYLQKLAERTEFTIDVVRRIGPFFAKTGSFSRRRIVIVDQAEMLNREASNALLKRLEEPPRGGMMILIARSLGSLLPTVLSRCAKVPFAALSPADFGAWCAASGQQELAALGPAAGYSPGQALGLSDGKVLVWLEQLDALGQSEGEARRDRLAASLAAAIGKTGDQSFRNPFLRALRARQPRSGSGQSGQDQRLYRAALDAFARIDAIKVNPEDEWRALLRHF